MRLDRWMTGLVLISGCDDAIDLDPLDDTPPVEARVRPKPISGGTLAIVDGVAIAADPDRDLVHIVDLAEQSVLHTVALEPGDEPGRVVTGNGLAHVVLRGFGGVASIDRETGVVIARHSVCSDPRGIAVDPRDWTLHVACADGALVQLDVASGEELARQQLEPDLRDVVLFDGAIHVSTFRGAELLRTDGTRTSLPSFDGIVPHVAWRTIAAPELGAIAVLHHSTSTSPVPIDLGPDDVEGADSPYGAGGGGCQPGITGPAISIVGGDLDGTFPLLGARLTVDAALSPNGGMMAVAMPGVTPEGPSARMVSIGGDCLFDEEDDPMGIAGRGQITAVAFTPDGSLVMQSREPARLLVSANPQVQGTAAVIELEGEPRFDSGHEIFHRPTESGLSCASCHPEGTDDGHVWTFEGLGKRRTQSLEIGLADTAPFHWDGDMDDLDMIMAEVMAHRMGGARQSKARGESFARWMFEQKRPPANAFVEAALVDSGESLFFAYACDKCHDGPELGGTTTESYRGAELQVPSLRRVSLRPPFMHDGRSKTLDAAVRDMIEGTVTTDPPQENVDAIVAYLRTL
jgi:hypothetical protein